MDHRQQLKRSRKMKSILKLSICALTVSVLAIGTAFAERGEGGGKGGRNPADIFAKIDADGNGSVTLDEFTTAHEKRVARMKERKGDRERPEGARTPPAAGEIFSRIDSDGDNAVSQEEFEAHMKSRKGRRGGNKQ